MISDAAKKPEKAPNLRHLTSVRPSLAGRPFFSTKRARQARRLRILRSIMLRAADARQQGRSVAAVFRRAAAYWDGRSYCSAAPKFKLHASTETLRRLFYRWQRSGGQVEALRPQYRPVLLGVTFTRVQRAQLLRSLDEASSIADLHRLVYQDATASPSYDSFLRFFTLAERARLRAIFLARRRHRLKEAAFRRWAQEPVRTFNNRPTRPLAATTPEAV